MKTALQTFPKMRKTFSRLWCVPKPVAQNGGHTAIGTIHDGGDGKGMGGRHGGYAKSWADMGEYKEVGVGGKVPYVERFMHHCWGNILVPQCVIVEGTVRTRPQPK